MALPHPIPADNALVRLHRPQLSALSDEKRSHFAATYVREHAVWASQLIQELVVGKDANTGIPKLTPAALREAQALAFINTHRGGLVIGYASGYGFIIKRVGSQQWGQPLLFTVSQAGIGLIAGFQQVQSLVTVQTAEGIDNFTRASQRSFGADLLVATTDDTTTLAGMPVRPGIGQDQVAETTKGAHIYSKVDGVFVDASLHGSCITPDKESNVFLYGDSYTQGNINNLLTSAEGPYMAALQPLVDTIKQLTA